MLFDGAMRASGWRAAAAAAAYSLRPRREPGHSVLLGGLTGELCRQLSNQ